jgi:formylglycine-generating enzyme required for sulfatase activity
LMDLGLYDVVDSLLQRGLRNDDYFHGSPGRILRLMAVCRFNRIDNEYVGLFEAEMGRLAEMQDQETYEDALLDLIKAGLTGQAVCRILHLDMTADRVSEILADAIVSTTGRIPDVFTRRVLVQDGLDAIAFDVAMQRPPRSHLVDWCKTEAKDLVRDGAEVSLTTRTVRGFSTDLARLCEQMGRWSLTGQSLAVWLSATDGDSDHRLSPQDVLMGSLLHSHGRDVVAYYPCSRTENDRILHTVLVNRPLGLEFVMVPSTLVTPPAGKATAGQAGGPTPGIPSFLISRTELTEIQFALYRRLSSGGRESMGSRIPSPADTARLPASSVSFGEASDFCVWLTDKYQREGNALPSGYCFRLPTEAEWEHCAQKAFPEGALTQDRVARWAWCAQGAQGKAKPVRTLEPDSVGTFDLFGNLWEWCLDAYYPDSRNWRTAHSPVYVRRRSGARVLKGGSFSTPASLLRPGLRRPGPESLRDPRVGFRVVVGVGLP